jgi:hypothetical protein
MLLLGWLGTELGTTLGTALHWVMVVDITQCVLCMGCGCMLWLVVYSQPVRWRACG